MFTDIEKALDNQRELRAKFSSNIDYRKRLTTEDSKKTLQALRYKLMPKWLHTFYDQAQSERMLRTNPMSKVCRR